MLPEVEAKNILESERGVEIGYFLTWKRTVARLISFTLVLTALYQIAVAFIDINSLLLSYVPPNQASQLQFALIRKALLITAASFFDILYAIILYLKPSRAIKKIHLATGAALVIGSFLILGFR